MDVKEAVDTIKQSQIFDGLGDHDLKKIAQGLVEQVFPMGTIIIEENDPPKNTLYFVRSGEITVTTSNIGDDGGSGDESLITTLGDGDAFGEIALVDQLPHSATIRTISDSMVYMLSASLLSDICEQDQRIGYYVYKNIAKLICQRLRHTNFSTKAFWLAD